MHTLHISWLPDQNSLTKCEGERRNTGPIIIFSIKTKRKRHWKKNPEDLSNLPGHYGRSLGPWLWLQMRVRQDTFKVLFKLSVLWIPFLIHIFTSDLYFYSSKRSQWMLIYLATMSTVSFLSFSNYLLFKMENEVVAFTFVNCEIPFPPFSLSSASSCICGWTSVSKNELLQRMFFEENLMNRKLQVFWKINNNN